jgi:glycosyltransferase 2 family protein
MNKSIVLYGRALLSLALIFYLFTMLDWDRIRYVLPRLRLGYVGQAYLLILLSILVSSVRWSALLKQFQVIQGILDSWRYYLISMFYGVMLPGVIGGDVVRLGLSIKQHGLGMKGILTAGILFERACGFMAILMIFAVMISFAPEILGGTQVLTGPIYALPIAIIAGFILFFVALKRGPERWFVGEASSRQGLMARMRLLLGRFRELSAFALTFILMLSLLINFVDILGSYLLSKALYLNVTFSLFLLVIPMTYVLTALPISLGGLGVREGILTFFLVKVGVMASDAVLLAFLIYLNRLAVALIGGIVQLRAGRSQPSKP